VPKANTSLLIHALLLSLFILVFYVFWFAVLPREQIFLYGHLGYGPLSDFNISRHWMTGLVVGEMLLMIYLPLNLILKKLLKYYQLPDWANLSCYLCLYLSLPLLVLLNFFAKPTLPFLLNLWIFLILFLAIRLVLYLTDLAFKNFKYFVWLTIDALSLLPVLMIVPTLMQYGLKRSFPLFGLFILLPLVMMLLGWLWFSLLTLLAKRFQRPMPSSQHLLLSALESAYLFFPFLHYFSSNPGGTLYISNSDNFFATNPLLQLGAFLLALVLLKIFIKQRQQKKDDFSATLKIFLLLTGLVMANFILRQILVV
jgi:hypothetical protein